jgi:hypothetical protein
LGRFQEVAARFNELAQESKWFEIQDEFFADNVRSKAPPNSPYLGMRKARLPFVKGEDFTNRIEAVHGLYTSEPV